MKFVTSNGGKYENLQVSVPYDEIVITLSLQRRISAGLLVIYGSILIIQLFVGVQVIEIALLVAGFVILIRLATLPELNNDLRAAIIKIIAIMGISTFLVIEIRGRISEQIRINSISDITDINAIREIISYFFTTTLILLFSILVVTIFTIIVQLRLLRLQIQSFVQLRPLNYGVILSVIIIIVGWVIIEPFQSFTPRVGIILLYAITAAPIYWVFQQITDFYQQISNKKIAGLEDEELLYRKSENQQEFQQ